MVRALAIVAVAATTGCHLLAGFDELDLRENPEPLWSRSYGDESAQGALDVSARGTDICVVGELAGSMTVGDATITSSAASDGFVLALDGNGGPRWVQLFSGSGDERVRTVAALPEELVVAGAYRDEITVGGQTLTAAGEAFFVATLDSESGAVNSAATFGTLELLATKLDTAVDGEGSLLVGGGFAGELDFGCSTPHSSEGPIDAFVTKLDASGCRWSKHWGDGQLQAIESLGVDIGGNVVVAGEFSGSMSLDSEHGLVSGGGIDIFLVKLDPEGNHLWSKRFGDPNGLQSSVVVAVHALGNVAIAGLFEGTVDFGGEPKTSSRGHDLFLAKFDPSGGHLWSHQYALEREPCALDDCQLDRIGLAVDVEGDLVLTGHFQGSVDFGGTTLTSAGASDQFVAKLDAEDGTLLWSGRYGDAKAQCTPPGCIAVAATDSQRNVFLTGFFEESIDFGLGLHRSVGDHDAFIVKLLP